MQGRAGDRLVVQGSRVGQPPRVGEIVEVVAGHGPGPARYLLRWSDGHQSVFSPGPGATIEAQPRIDAEWEATVAATHARCAAWRRGVVAGVGREASIAQSKLG